MEISRAEPRAWKMVISHKSPIYYNFYRPKINIKMRFQNKNLFFTVFRLFMAYRKSSNRPILFHLIPAGDTWKKEK